ncbi:MAG: amidohydrolase [Ignavibacteriales bacterium]
MKKTYIIIAFLITAVFSLHAQKPVPAAPQSEPILIKGGTAHLGDGRVIANALIGFTGGVITLVDSINGNADISGFKKVIDASGKHIYPGFIATNTLLGLIEIESVRATRDFTETGLFNPNVRSLIAYNTDSKIIPTVRNNGVLIAESTPTGGWISGSSCMMQLDGWNWEDAVLQPDAAIQLRWMSETDFRAQDMKLQTGENYNNYLSQVRSFFQDAAAYAQAKNPAVHNIRFEAIKGLYSGGQILLIHVNSAKDIITSVELAKQTGIKRIGIVGGAESYKVTAFLKGNDIPVLIRKLHSLPYSSSEDIDMPFKLPYILKQSDILFGFESGGEGSEVRNLPFISGTAAGYGLTFEDVVQGLTLNTAKIFGIDRHVGSLTTGKHATLFISEGNALEITGNKITHAFIQGKELDLRNEQTELYERYMKKYGLDK